MKIKLNKIAKRTNEICEGIKKGKLDEDLSKKIKKRVNTINETEDYEIQEPTLTKEYKRKGASSNYYKYKFISYFKNLFKNKKKLSTSYYLLLFAMLILGTISVVITIKSYKQISKESYNVFSNVDNSENKSNENPSQNLSSSVSTNIDSASQNSTTNNVQKNNEAIPTSTTNNSNTQKTSETKKAVVTVQPLSFAKPMDGEIIKPYSINKVLYSKTLELWKTHDGMDIAGDIGAYVKSIERGTVEKIYSDAFYGVTVIVDHGQGYKSQYSNLDTNVNVKEKQSIKKGTIIGKIGATAIGEIKDEPHLHIQLFKDGKSINPDDKF